MRTARIMLVDGHAVVRSGLRALLEGWDGFEVVAEAAHGTAALSQVRVVVPEIAIIEFRLADMRGDHLCGRLVEAVPGLRVVVFSGDPSDATVRSAHRAGAWGYLDKSADRAQLRRTLEAVRHGINPSASGAAKATAHSVRLTLQQAQVLELAAAGMTAREIGRELYLAESTVRFHIQKLKARLNVRNKTELVATAIRTGLVPPLA